MLPILRPAHAWRRSGLIVGESEHGISRLHLPEPPGIPEAHMWRIPRAPRPRPDAAASLGPSATLTVGAGEGAAAGDAPPDTGPTPVGPGEGAAAGDAPPLPRPTPADHPCPDCGSDPHVLTSPFMRGPDAGPDASLPGVERERVRARGRPSRPCPGALECMHGTDRRSTGAFGGRPEHDGRAGPTPAGPSSWPRRALGTRIDSRL